MKAMSDPKQTVCTWILPDFCLCFRVTAHGSSCAWPVSPDCGPVQSELPHAMTQSYWIDHGVSHFWGFFADPRNDPHTVPQTIPFLNKTFTLSYCERGPCSSLGFLSEIQCKNLWGSYLNSQNRSARREGKLYSSFPIFSVCLRFP